MSLYSCTKVSFYIMEFFSGTFVTTFDSCNFTYLLYCILVIVMRLLRKALKRLTFLMAYYYFVYFVCVCIYIYRYIYMLVLAFYLFFISYEPLIFVIKN